MLDCVDKSIIKPKMKRTVPGEASLALVQILSLPILGRSDRLKVIRWSGSWVCCAKNVFYEHGAVPEMKEGPSEPVVGAGFKQP
jgi:hypothetical protein